MMTEMANIGAISFIAGPLNFKENNRLNRQLDLPSVPDALNYPAIFIMHWNIFLADTAAPVTTTAASSAASAGPSTPTPPGLLGSPIIFLVLIGVMMYFMLFRPQQQRQKQQAKLMANLKAGDRVVTSSGIVGTVTSVKDKTVSLRSADAKMEVTKSSVTEILESGDATSSSS
jgi:preprotein translocase subunit YajC